MQNVREEGRIVTDRWWHPRRGIAVRVRPGREILTTLDEQGRCDGLPFQPEMWQYCGRTLTVSQVVNRIYIEKGTVRKLPRTVMLDGVRCDGSAHNGCQRRCHLLFKWDWLEPVAGNDPAVTAMDEIACSTGEPCQGQASVLVQATAPLPFWHPQQYIADLVTRRLGLCDLLRMFWYMFVFRVRRGKPRPRRAVAASTGPTPPTTLGLQAGDLVQVRSAEEIAATLDAQGKCRGLYFSTEGMSPYCGKRYRVVQRVEYMIDEVSERPVKLANTVILEDVTCAGIGLRGCPRACYWLWREAWLERV